MEKGGNFVKEVSASVKKTRTSYQVSTKAMQEDKEQLKKQESGCLSMNPKPDVTFFGIVSAIIDPGEFYVVHSDNIRARQHFFERIQNTAPIFLPFDAVIPGQMYSVRSSSDQKWFRAIAGVYFGSFQVSIQPN